MRPVRPDRRKMTIQNVHRSNGKVLEGEKIGELVSSIINKFSEKELSCDEAKIILQLTIDTLEEFCTARKLLKILLEYFLKDIRNSTKFLISCRKFCCEHVCSRFYICCKCIRIQEAFVHGG